MSMNKLDFDVQTSPITLETKRIHSTIFALDVTLPKTIRSLSITKCLTLSDY